MEKINYKNSDLVSSLLLLSSRDKGMRQNGYKNPESQ